ncbi:MAG TPA: hypothetical protein VE173_06165 [Longimicrobiales bacterium]|nr:hypothetical protein [Longimicrobiales bacterium]
MIRRSRVSTPSLVALAFAALLASLSFVTWRQGRALEDLAELDQVRRERSLAEANRVEVQRRIQVLESRGRVASEARRRLEMHTPASSEIVYLAGGEP